MQVQLTLDVLFTLSVRHFSSCRSRSLPFLLVTYTLTLNILHLLLFSVLFCFCLLPLR